VMTAADPFREVEDRRQIETVLLRYAQACDEKDWDRFDEVFIPSVKSSYSGTTMNDRVAIRERISGLLDNCGVTQHLIGNIQIDLDGDEASTFCKVRGWHQGVGAWDGVFFEAFGHYDDHFLRTPQGWLIDRREFVSEAALGTRNIFLPVPGFTDVS
jgi:3-phenylpropionate/cinnamic acid dioxygenase small subunit